MLQSSLVRCAPGHWFWRVSQGSVFGALEPKTGACGSVINIANHKSLNHRIDVSGGILAEECSAMVSDFFKRNVRLKEFRELVERWQSGRLQVTANHLTGKLVPGFESLPLRH